MCLLQSQAAFSRSTTVPQQKVYNELTLAKQLVAEEQNKDRLPLHVETDIWKLGPLKPRPKTSKEVEERLLSVVYEFDKRKHYLHTMNTNIPSDLTWTMEGQDFDHFCSLLDREFVDVPFEKCVIVDCKKLRDIHAYLCTQMLIETEPKTVREVKAEKRKLAAGAKMAEEEESGRGNQRRRREFPRKMNEKEAEEAEADALLAQHFGYNFAAEKKPSITCQEVQDRILRLLREYYFAGDEEGLKLLKKVGLNIILCTFSFNALGKRQGLFEKLEDEFGVVVFHPAVTDKQSMDGRHLYNHICRELHISYEGEKEEEEKKKQREEEGIKRKK